MLPEVVGLVLRCLHTHVDRVRFTAVCSKWRHAAQKANLPPPLPLLMIPDGTVYGLPRSKPFRISSCSGYTAVCGKWLVFSSEDGDFLRDPLSNITVKLPSTSRVRARHVNDNDLMDGMSLPKMLIIKFIFGSSSLIVASVAFGQSLRIAVCKPGATSWWSVYMGNMLKDMAVHQGTLYALGIHDKGLFAIDINVDLDTGDPWVSRIQHVINGTPTCPLSHVDNPCSLILMKDYLVESCGKLLMVRITVMEHRKIAVATEHPETKVEVFEAIFEQSKWNKMTSIGEDQVFFLRQSCCRSVCISQYNVLEDQIVFFENDGVASFKLAKRQSCCSVYDMRDGQISTSLPMISWMHGAGTATWLFPEA
ncbi:hypothetical protein EJB05_26845, partial [Eragrostis curvula]